MNAKKLFYRVARDDIQSGDAILWQGNGVLSKMIRWWAPPGLGFTHASLVVRMDDYTPNYPGDRVFLIETLGRGLVPRLLSERVKSYNGKAFWLRTRMNDQQRFRSREQALIWSGKGIRYDWGLRGLLGNALGAVSVDFKRLFCSEWVQVNWTGCGYVSEEGSRAKRPWDLVPYGELIELVPYVENQAQTG